MSSLYYDQEMIEVDISEGLAVPADPVEAYIHSLMSALLREEWDQVCTDLQRAKEILKNPTDTQHLGVLLGAACFKESVPLEIFERCLQIDRKVALYQDGGLRSPLQVKVLVLLFRERNMPLF